LKPMRRTILLALLIIGAGGAGCWPSPAGPDRDGEGEEQEPDEGGPDNFAPVGFFLDPT